MTRIHVALKDEKAEHKKDGDVEMKDDASPTPKHGDISPINGSLSHLAAEDDKPSSSKPARKAEPTSEALPNFSRVTPAQLTYVAFPPDGRYQPVRPVAAKVMPPRPGKATNSFANAGWESPSERYSGGGGILILEDLRPEEEAEFIELRPPPPPAAVPNGHAIAGPPVSGPHIALDESESEADLPEPFEVCLHYHIC